MLLFYDNVDSFLLMAQDVSSHVFLSFQTFVSSFFSIFKTFLLYVLLGIIEQECLDIFGRLSECLFQIVKFRDMEE